MRCYFGKEFTPAATCNFSTSAPNHIIEFIAPLNYDVSKCPIVITLTVEDLEYDVDPNGNGFVIFGDNYGEQVITYEVHT